MLAEPTFQPREARERTLEVCWGFRKLNSNTQIRHGEGCSLQLSVCKRSGFQGAQWKHTRAWFWCCICSLGIWQRPAGPSGAAALKAMAVSAADVREAPPAGGVRGEECGAELLRDGAADVRRRRHRPRGHHRWQVTSVGYIYPMRMPSLFSHVTRCMHVVLQYCAAFLWPGGLASSRSHLAGSGVSVGCPLPQQATPRLCTTSLHAQHSLLPLLFGARPSA